MEGDSNRTVISFVLIPYKDNFSHWQEEKMKKRTYPVFAVIFSFVLCCTMPACDDAGGDTDGEDKNTGNGENGDSDAGAGSDTDTDTDTDSDTDTDTDTDSDSGMGTATCETLQEGMNSGFMVDGEARSFVLNLPQEVETGGPWAVIFNWHGLGDNATNFSGFVSIFADNEDMPFIGVTPEDTDHVLMAVPLDWDVFKVDENNKEARLFDEVLECLDQKWGVDFDHVHTMGFSLGSVVSDMLGTVRGEMLASIATYSGGYWCNEENLLPLMGTVIKWPVYSTENAYAQLFFHGGETDTFGIMNIGLKFNEYAVNDSAFLKERGHDTIICNHDLGHTVPADMSTDKVLEFFAAHPLGTEVSPWRSSGLPGDYAGYCSFKAGD